MEPITPQMKRKAFEEKRANERKALYAVGHILDDADEAVRRDPDNKAAIYERSKAVRRENQREIDTAYAVKSGATMAELAAKGKDIEVSGDALRRAKTGQKPKIQTTL